MEPPTDEEWDAIIAESDARHAKYREDIGLMLNVDSPIVDVEIDISDWESPGLVWSRFRAGALPEDRD